MQVQQMIRNSAEVLTITTLSPGNVYKRVEETSYTSGPVLRYGVVQSVMNNGEDSAVTALEYAADYNGTTAQVRVFTGSVPVAIFPATPEEVTQHLEELRSSAQKALARAEDEVTAKKASLDAVERMAATVGELTAPDTITAELTPQS